jgi:hypothetical protein
LVFCAPGWVRKNTDDGALLAVLGMVPNEKDASAAGQVWNVFWSTHEGSGAFLMPGRLNRSHRQLFLNQVGRRSGQFWLNPSCSTSSFPEICTNGQGPRTELESSLPLWQKQHDPQKAVRVFI